MKRIISLGIAAAILAGCATRRSLDPQVGSTGAAPGEQVQQLEELGVRPRVSSSLKAATIRAQVQAGGELRLYGVIVQNYSFTRGASSIEAVVVRPEQEGAAPGLVLIPGYSRTAYDMLPLALRFARAGFATVAVSQPGFGQSSGPADFVGPRTFDTLVAVARRFAAEPYVDARRLGVYGYSRGALAAAQLATRTDLFRAAVLGGGIYDFAAAYDQVRAPDIRANMMQETGMGPQAIRFRSPIHDLDGLDGPVLIIHGASDLSAPADQARALASRLAAAGRTHELILLGGKDHSLSVSDIVPPALAFLRRHLAATAAAPTR